MSKGLKALKSLEKIVSNLYGMDIAYDKKTFDLFCDIGKELNALEIIKNKKVLIHIIMSVESLKEYNGYSSGYMVLTQEEYDLLKEVLK